MKLSQLKHRVNVNIGYLLNKIFLNSYPIELVVELTNRCNMNCAICPRDKMNYPLGDMEFKLFKKIVDEVKGKVEMIDFCFRGESLLHKEVFKFIKYAKESGIKTFLQTNGLVLNEEVNRGIVEAGVDLLILSIDAYSEETYKKIRNNENFKAIVKNCEDFLKMKNSTGPYTVVQMVTTKFNLNEAEQFKNFWYSKGADSVRLKAFNSRAGLVDKSFANVKKFSKQKKCIRLWRSMAICWDGSVVACCMDYQGEYVIGDLKKQSIFEIWNSKEMQALRQKHVFGKINEVELCKNCETYSASVVKVLGSSFFDALTIRKILYM